MKILNEIPNFVLPHDINNFSLNQRLEKILSPLMIHQGANVNKEVTLTKELAPHKKGVYVGNYLTEDGVYQPIIKVAENIFISLDKNDCLNIIGTKKKVVQGIAYGLGSNINKMYKQYIYERDNYCCLKCKTTENLSVDHIVPRSKGGTNSIHNLQTLCSQCNCDKGSEIIDYRVIKNPLLKDESNLLLHINNDTKYVVNRDGSISYIIDAENVLSKIKMDFNSWLDYFKQIKNLNEEPIIRLCEN